MNENLLKAIKTMLWMADQSVYDEDIPKIVKKKNWFQQYTWTGKTEERYSRLLSEMLKTYWQGIVEEKPLNKKHRDKLAQEFVMNYGLKTRLLKSEDFTNVVPWDYIKEVMTELEFKRFRQWMFGQTCSDYGVYRWDLERWLRYGSEAKNEPLVEMD